MSSVKIDPSEAGIQSHPVGQFEHIVKANRDFRIKTFETVHSPFAPTRQPINKRIYLGKSALPISAIAIFRKDLTPPTGAILGGSTIG
jgi:hypothetical protein